jgi:Flp pilus assembly protein TadG
MAHQITRAIYPGRSYGRQKQETQMIRNLFGSGRALAAFARDERGSVAVIATIVLPVMVGGMGLGAETGYWYLKQRKLQHAADVSVHAAAIRLRAGDAQPSIEDAALVVASRSGYSAVSGNTVDVGTPSASATGSKIAVTLTESHPRLFSSIFSHEPMILKARAVAQVSGGSQACVLALSGTASGAVTVSGSTSVSLANCSVASNSMAPNAFLMESGKAEIAADCVYTVGEAVTTTGLTLNKCTKPTEHSPATLDPYAGVLEPERMHLDQLPCRTLADISAPGYSLDYLPDGQQAMRFCSGLSIKGDITLQPGLYIIDGGDFSVTAGATFTGNGVTLMFARTATAKLTGNGEIDLSAPTAGPYAGLLFFGSRTATGVEHQVLGNSASRLQGTLYTPASTIEFSGNSTVAGACTQIVADRVTFTGNSTIETCTSGTKDILVGQVVSIVE